jgi:murein DD-endopeptidase MepM/ murein hydrolase activator NlpD
MPNPFPRIFLALLATTLLTSCAVSGGYWVPPSSPPTQVLFLPPAPAAGGQPLEAPAPLETASAEPALPTEPDPFSTQDPFLLLTEPVDTPTLDVAALPTPTATPEIYVVDTSPILYYAQAADTLRVVAVRFGVAQNEISSPEPVSETSFINPGQLLIIPRRLANTTTSRQIIPDSEVVYSPSAVDFDSVAYANTTGGYLASFREWHKSTGMKTGAEIVERVAIENSINPRLLLALLEFHSHWVYSQPETANQKDYPLGRNEPRERGLYNQLVWTVNQLAIGYYAYREGRLTEIRFSDGARTRLAPDLNAGTAALQYYFAQLYDSTRWLEALDVETGFPSLQALMFGDPWERARTVEPLYPPGIVQPALTLPFGRNWTWSYTGGPHGAWEHDGAYAALDFAPGAAEAGCIDTPAWAVAAAAGLVVRTGPGLVVLDLDGDGHEQTGWVLVYLHLAESGRIQQGAWVAVGDPLGHPSCEGGFSTGTHLHIARKFNGEWVPADGALPFNLGGWVAHAGPLAYKGTLTRGDVILEACTCSNYKTFITRTESDP